jgi:hypothetical protein
VSTLSNYSGGTLNGGTYSATGGRLELNVGAITTNAANILVSGSSSSFVDLSGNQLLRSLTTNAAGAALAIENGYNYTSSGAFTNNGTLTIGDGGKFTSTGKFTLAGTGLLDFLIGSPTSYGQLDLSSTDSFTGTVDATFSTAFAFEQGTTIFDLITAQSAANLAGITVDVLDLPMGVTYTQLISGNQLELEIIAAPEPSSLAIGVAAVFMTIGARRWRGPERSDAGRRANA